MELQLRKLYLYAANSPKTKRNFRETSAEYKTKKQKSLTNLKKLLQQKAPLLPVASLKDYYTIQQKYQSKQLKITTKRDKNLQSDEKSYLFLPKVSKMATQRHKQKINQNIESLIQQKIQIQIQQYVKRIQNDNLLDQYEDRTVLVQKAVKQIREKVYRQLKKQHRASKLQRKGMQKQPIENNKKKVYPSNKQGQQEIDNKRILRKKKSLSLIKNKHRIRYKNSLQHYQIQGDKNFYQDHKLRLSPNRTFLHENSTRRHKQLANNNLYMINLDLINKNSQLKNRERRRSERSFVRKLSRSSFYDISLN